MEVTMKDLKPLKLKWHERAMGMVAGGAVGTVVLAKAPQIEWVRQTFGALDSVSPLLSVGVGVGATVAAVYSAHYLASRFFASTHDGARVVVQDKGGLLNLPQIKIVAPMEQQPPKVQKALAEEYEHFVIHL